ncbi:MAG: hypothetical protein R3Y19_01615, partial [Rikenellaceae bacterium]
MLKKIVLLTLITILSGSCKVSYTFSGASISADVKTASVSYFNNIASMVAPILSPTFTDALTDKIQRETRLEIEREDGDVSFSG